MALIKNHFISFQKILSTLKINKKCLLINYWVLMLCNEQKWQHYINFASQHYYTFLIILKYSLWLTGWIISILSVRNLQCFMHKWWFDHSDIFWHFFFIFIKLHQHHNGSKLRLIMGREGTVSFPNLATNMRIRKLRDRCCLWIKLHYSNILCIQVVPVDDWWWLTFSKVELHEELVGHTVRA